MQADMECKFDWWRVTDPMNYPLYQLTLVTSYAMQIGLMWIKGRMNAYSWEENYVIR